MLKLEELTNYMNYSTNYSNYNVQFSYNDFLDGFSVLMFVTNIITSVKRYPLIILYSMLQFCIQNFARYFRQFRLISV